MNQILSMDPNNSGFGSNYNNLNGGNNGNNGKLDNKTTKRIFAIALIIFGLAIFVSGLIGVLSVPEGPIIEYPIVSTMQTDNVLTINIKNDVAIDLVEYAWNNGRVSEIDGNRNAEITRDITVPVGENVLSLTIIDVNGKKTELSKSFVGIAIEDKTPPEIDVVVVSSKLNITARTVSETKLSYLTYKWNNDPEIKLDAVGDQTSIETTIDVLNGTNTLTIVAVNENGISQTRVDEYIGVKKPVIEVKKDETGEYLLVKISHENAVKSAEITFNGKNISLTPDRFGKPEVELSIKLTQKTNSIKIVATSINDSTETFNGTATKD